MNNNKSNKKISYNPKAHAPAVYIPSWLIQVPTELLSTNAKMLYGRLAQWSTENGEVFRSSKQLSEELGTPQRTIERHLKELRDTGLIRTLQPQQGGINHFEFLEHEWMSCPINSHLCYQNDIFDPPPKMAVPPAKNGGTPPPKMAGINKKEIREIKEPPIVPQKGTNSDSFFEDFWEQYPIKKAKKKCHEIWKKKKLFSKAEIILSRLKNQMENDKQWIEGYVPNPVTYLNQERWDDEIVPTAEKKKSNEKKEREEKHKKLIQYQDDAQRFQKVKRQIEVRSKPSEDFEILRNKLKQET